MAAQAELGLKFDLSAWVRGIKQAAGVVKKAMGPAVFTPFQRAAQRAAKAMRSTFQAAGRAIGAALKSAFAPLLALIGVTALFTGLKRVIEGSLQAFRDYSDSVTTLQAALRTLDGANVDAITQRVTELGNQLRMALGITSAETNRAFSNFVTRGFDERQARQLTILAANYAKKAGKPLKDVSKQVADAANGSVDAMKELGVQITTTGDKVKDGEAAVLAMKAAYGDIGADLANPSERLAAAWNQLAVTLGEKIAPVLEPIIQGFADFVTGLSQTEEGQKAAEGFANAFAKVVDFIGESIVRVVGFVSAVKNGAQVIYHTVREILLRLSAEMTDLYMKHPVFRFLSGKLGFDGKAWSESLREMSKDSARQSAEAIGRWETGVAQMRGERTGGLIGQVANIRDAGRQAREQATVSLAGEIAATRNETFAGDPARQAQAMKEAQAAAAAQKKAQATLAGRARAFGEVGEGQQIRVNIVSRRPDRFRKARLA